MAKNDDADYKYLDVKTTSNGIELKITHKSDVLSLKSYVLGDYMADNICAAFAMAHQNRHCPRKNYRCYF